MQESARAYQQQVNYLNVASSNATYYDAQLVSSSDDPHFQDNLISINSQRHKLQFGKKKTRVSAQRYGNSSPKADPWLEYQPIVKNLKNMTLRNRNLFPMTEKMQMPAMSATKICEHAGSTRLPKDMSLSESKPRQAFLKKYITSSPHNSNHANSDAKVNSQASE